MNRQNDNNIIRDFSKGKEYAFRYIYDKYAPSLRHFAYKYLEDGISIDDVVQDAFVKLWEQRNIFNIENTLKSFLYKTVKNQCLNIIRHSVVKQKHSQRVLDEDTQEFFLDNILETEVFHLLLTVFEELSPSCKEVYRMSLNGFKHEEIAEELNISVNTVKKHKNNANNYMRERLKNILSLLMSF